MERRLTARQYRRRGRGAGVAAGPDLRVLWLFVLVAAALLLAAPLRAQPVPEVVRPQNSSPTVPPTGDTMVRPRSESPLVEGGKPLADRGVIAPPAGSAGAGTVIRPPAEGAMPVVPPPGSSGGDRSVVPK